MALLESWMHVIQTLQGIFCVLAADSGRVKFSTFYYCNLDGNRLYPSGNLLSKNMRQCGTAKIRCLLFVRLRLISEVAYKKKKPFSHQKYAFKAWNKLSPAKKKKEKFKSDCEENPLVGGLRQTVVKHDSCLFLKKQEVKSSF